MVVGGRGRRMERRISKRLGLLFCLRFSFALCRVASRVAGRPPSAARWRSGGGRAGPRIGRQEFDSEAGSQRARARVSRAEGDEEGGGWGRRQ